MELQPLSQTAFAPSHTCTFTACKQNLGFVLFLEDCSSQSRCLLPLSIRGRSGFLCLSVMRTKHLNWAWSVDLGSREETTFKSSSDISKQTEMEIMEMEFLSHLNELIKCGCKDSTATSSVLAIIKHVYNNIQESPSKRLIGMIINVQERGWRLHLNVRDD